MAQSALSVSSQFLSEGQLPLPAKGRCLTITAKNLPAPKASVSNRKCCNPHALFLGHGA